MEELLEDGGDGGAGISGRVIGSRVIAIPRLSLPPPFSSRENIAINADNADFHGLNLAR